MTIATRCARLAGGLLAAAAVAGGPAAPANADFSGMPEIHGSGSGDTLYGTNSAEALHGHEGADFIHARRGNDALYGGPDLDYLHPGPGIDRVDAGHSSTFEYIYDDDASPDYLDGGLGRDKIYAANGVADQVDCGERFDRAVVDPHDTVHDCERVVSADGMSDEGEYPGVSNVYVMGENTDEIISLSEPAGVVAEFRVFAKGGKDLIGSADLPGWFFPGDGPDHVFGSKYRDEIHDGDDDYDVLRGNDGDDRIFTANGSPDWVDCGAGTDVAHTDTEDTVTGCEHWSAR